MGVDPDLFFPERGASTREAKEVCRGCVVREDCLEYALGQRREVRHLGRHERAGAPPAAPGPRPGPPGRGQRLVGRHRVPLAAVTVQLGRRDSTVASSERPSSAQRAGGHGGEDGLGDESHQLAALDTAPPAWVTRAATVS